MQVIALLDDKPGNRTQVLGVADYLEGNCTEITLHPQWLSVLPNTLLGARLCGYSPADRTALGSIDHADIIVAAGRRMAPALRALKKRFPKALAVYLMHPKMPLRHFDAVVIPEHDAPPKRPNVIASVGTPHRLTAARVADAFAASAAEWERYPSPRFTVLVGGNADGCSYTEQDWANLGKSLALNIARLGGSLLVTTSRRTGEAGTEQLAAHLPAGSYLHAWQATGDNPMLGMLGAADAIIVTGESMSMLSEACSLGKPVFIANPARGIGGKHAHFQHRLIELGLARLWTPHATLEWRPAYPLNEAKRVADALRVRYESSLTLPGM
jgi:uncharacterized protein